MAQDFQVILDPGLGEQPLELSEEHLGLVGGVRRVDQTGGVRVADDRFEIFALLIQNLPDQLLELILLRADFRSQAE